MKSKINLGSLVKSSFDVDHINLYPNLDNLSLNDDLRFHKNEVGIVLEISELSPLTHVKIFTGSGIGWTSLWNLKYT